MKNVVIALVFSAGALVGASGCATPAYSGGLPTIKFPEEQASGENANNILRAWHIESRQIADDLNHLMLFEPSSRMTKWNVR